MKKVLFFDPHPGLAGCTEYLPPEVGAVADELEDTIGTVDGAIKMIKQAVPSGKVTDHPTDKMLFTKPDPNGYGMICLQIGDFENDILVLGNSWRVLRYRPLEK